jgi:hypothetical protein
VCKSRRASAWHGAPVYDTGPNHRQYVVDGYEYFSQKKAAQVSGLKCRGSNEEQRPHATRAVTITGKPFEGGATLI